MRPTSWGFARRTRVAAAVIVSLSYILAIVWASRKPDRDARRREEADVLRFLGDARIGADVGLLGRHDSIQTMFTGGVSRHDENALMAVGGAGPTLREKVAASRGPAGEPAELCLSPELPVPDLGQRLGPPSSKFLVKSRSWKTAESWSWETVEFSSYGNLDVGVLDGKAVIVRVR